MSVFNDGHFYVEHAYDVPDFKKVVAPFRACHGAQGLEDYLKQQALWDEEHNNARTYLVFDAVNDELVGYFSLRTCLVPYPDDGQEMQTGSVIEHVCFFLRKLLRRKAIQILPAIELSNFARNADYQLSESVVGKLGAYVLDHFVWPLVQNVSLVIGARFLCLYALNNTKLIKHYEAFGFSKVDERIEQLVYARTKPHYDQGCIFMLQFIHR